MTYLLAILPILTVLALMLFLHWGGQKAGLAGWILGVLIAAAFFGLTWNVFWVSQVKGLLLSLNVLLILWAALFLFHLVDQVGGIQAVSHALDGVIADRGLLLLILAWPFSSLIEGVAGFGLPMAIVAPMLIGLGVSPLSAVAAAAVGHGWAVTYGSMGIVFQTLVSVVQIDPRLLVPTTAFLLTITCLLCGLGTAALLKQLRLWPVVTALSVFMGAVQYLVVSTGFYELGAFLASAAGILAAILLSRKPKTLPRESAPSSLSMAILAYGLVVAFLIVSNLIRPLRAGLSSFVLHGSFPEVVTLTGTVTPAGPGQIFRPLMHPGTVALASAGISYLYFVWKKKCPPWIGRKAAVSTWRSALPASLGVVSMVGLSTLMEHTGMTMLLAQGLAQAMGAGFPLVSPLVGMLGAFATGSNTNSNVLFGPLQKNAAILLGIQPATLASSQTVGGTIGTMIAPAKLVVGSSTTGHPGQDGEVLRQTLPIGLGIGLIIGFITWVMVGMS